MSRMSVMRDVPPTSRELLERLLERDATAWHELVASYAPFLLALARRRFGRYGHHASASDVEDVVGEVWANLLDNDMRIVRQTLDRGDLIPVLTTLVRNRTVDLLRKVGRVALTPEHILHTESDDESVDAQLLDHEQSRWIRSAVDALPERQRTVVTLFFLHERSYREIAKLTGMPQNSIGPTLQRAMCKLRTALASTRGEEIKL